MSKDCLADWSTVEQMRDMLEHELGSDILLDEIERYLGCIDILEIYDDIAIKHEIING